MLPRKTRFSGVILTAAFALSACGSDSDSTATAANPPPPVAAPPAAPPYELTILHINDHHSTLAERTGRTLQLRTGAAETRSAVTVTAAGFARVTRAFDELGGGKPNLLKLHAGDATTGTLYFNRAGEPGEPDAAMMNTVCFDAFTLGNHEFDKGDSGLKGFLDLLRQGSCQTPVLSANVQLGVNSALHPSRAPGYVLPSTVIERGGQRIGVIGLTIAGKTKASSSPDPDTMFEDEAVAAQREIDRLKAAGIDKIIVMSHIGYDSDRQLAAALSGVDIIVGGDSHTLLGPAALATYGVGDPAGDYPTVLRNRDGDTVCVVQAWEYGQVVGELKVSFDPDGVVTQCSGTPHVLIGDDFKVAAAAVTDAQRAAITADVAAAGFLRTTAPDATAVAVLAPYSDKIAVFNQTVVAQVDEELCSRRVPGGAGSVDFSRSSTSCNALGEVSLRGGDIQQLAAQAYLEVARAQYGGADLSLQSGGGVRVPLLPGPVTAAQVIEVLPFGNMLFRLELTGAEVEAMLEDGLEAVYGPGGTTGPYPYTGGLRFDVDASRPFGERVSAVEVQDSATGAWGPLDPARSYKLFVLSFNASGGDGYATLARVPAARRLDIGVLDADVFFDYIQSQPIDAASGLPSLRKAAADRYSTKRFVAPTAAP
ncbi:MAG: bifunctional UDP-sugar hydrolase/5'-nucleotidase [Lautropia sp.]